MGAMNAMTATDWSSAEKILCVRLDSLGDVLMCTPALHAIKHSDPGRSITLLSSHSGVAVAPFIPDIDAVIAYPAPWMKSSMSNDAAADLALMNLLQSNHFDAAIIFTSYSQSPLPAAMICYFAGIPRRLAHCRENPYQMLSDWIPDPEPQKRIRHEVRRQLDLVASVGYRTSDEKLCFAVRDSDLAWMRNRLDATACAVVWNPHVASQAVR